jgi:two-component system, NtrC family, response regulator
MFLKRILIIDDEDKLRSLLARIISLENFTVVEAATAKAGLKKLEQEEFGVVICDVRLPDGNGVELTQKIRSSYPLTEVIVLTAHGTISDGVQAIKYGAFDYITKGDDNEKILPLINRAMEKAELQHRLHQLENKVSKRYSFDSIIGVSKSIKEAIALSKKVAITDTTVLLMGETGTGKEIFAQAIHYAGTRSRNNFVAVNCAAISKEILESELFGHIAGAFTGAIKTRKGLFEEANEGTIFLDEIGELGLEMQTKLLRVLETSEFIKVGDTKPYKVNVRVIAATNRDLAKEVDEGRFRSDLFYRLAVFQIHLPALRERSDDIELLMKHFLQLYATRMNKKPPKVSKEFLNRMKRYPWKGNIRELKNTIERIMILSDSIELTLDDIPLEMQATLSDENSTTKFDLNSVEKEHIKKVLKYTQGNKTEAAKLMNIGLTTLYRKIQDYKLE